MWLSRVLLLLGAGTGDPESASSPRAPAGHSEEEAGWLVGLKKGKAALEKYILLPNVGNVDRAIGCALASSVFSFPCVAYQIVSYKITSRVVSLKEIF